MAVAALKTQIRQQSEGATTLKVAELERRIEAVKSAASRARRLEGERVGGRLIEVTDALSCVVPGGGLKPGASYLVEGSTALAAALIAKPSAEGSWCGVVAMPGFGAEGAAEFGADLSRLVFVPRPGRDWVNVVVALIDALSIVVVRPPSQISDGEAARLSARLRQREAVLIACGRWPRPEARISVSDSRWSGLGTGHGHLTSRQVEVTSVGRGAAMRPWRTTLWLPDSDGNVRVDDSRSRVRRRRASRGDCLMFTRTMVIWCPDWPVTAAILDADARGESLGDKPIALFDKGFVFACSANARAEGVRRGQRRRDAQSRCPDLLVLPYDAAVDIREFEPLVSAIEQVAPGVEVIRPGTCAVKARGPSRYFGSEEQAAYAITSPLRRLGFFDSGDLPRVGCADGPFAAEQAARATSAHESVCIVGAGESPAFLRDLPVGLLGQPDLADLLRRLGLHSLGDFAKLSSTDVLTRFGPIGSHAHRLAGGGDQRGVVARRPPPELTAWVELEQPADRVDQVAFAVRQAADGFVSALASEGLVCTSLLVQVVTEDGPGSQRCWLHPRWFDAADVVDRVRWQLQGNGRIDSGLTSAVVRVGLVPDEVDPIGAHADGLWGGAPDEKVHRALTRVQSMLGHGEVCSAVVGGGRGPADRQALVPWGDRAKPSWSGDAPWTGKLPQPAPTTVYPEPQPAVVLSDDNTVVAISDRGVLSGRPAKFSPCADKRHPELQPVDAWAGPWPVSERWWDTESDSDKNNRRLARFQLVGADGSAWLLMLCDGQWWTEARYD